MNTSSLIENFINGEDINYLLDSILEEADFNNVLECTAHIYLPDGLPEEVYEKYLHPGIEPGIEEGRATHPASKKELHQVGSFGLTYGQAHAITGGLSNPGKMPGYGYSLPAWRCHVGSVLHKIAKNVCHNCYARAGRYLFPNTATNTTKRIDSISHPHWAPAMATQIAYHARKINYRGKEVKPHVLFRWHDSGDLQSPEHLEKIAEVARMTKDHDVKHWLPTKEYKHLDKWLEAGKRLGKKDHELVPENMVIRVSHPSVDERATSLYKKYSHIPGISFASVTDDEHFSGHTCPAGKQDGMCIPKDGSPGCIKCWDRNTKDINYPKRKTPFTKKEGEPKYKDKGWLNMIQDRANKWSQKFKSQYNVGEYDPNKVAKTSDHHDKMIKMLGKMGGEKYQNPGELIKIGGLK
jgi:hypothetical protein